MRLRTPHNIGLQLPIVDNGPRKSGVDLPEDMTIFNHMVKYSHDETQLDAIFAALGDKTRRAIIHQLTEGPASIGEIAAPHQMSLPAVSKHVKILERAGLLIREPRGRVHYCRIDADCLAAATGWIEDMRAFWTDRLDNLDAYLTAQKGNEE